MTYRAPHGNHSRIRILLCGTRETNSRVASRLEEEGLQTSLLDVVEVKPALDLLPLDLSLDRISDYDWLVFTSQNAVRSVVTRMNERACSPISGVRIAAVGGETASALRAAGALVHCAPDVATASEVAATLIRQDVQGARILLLVGNRARRELPDQLAAAGASVDEVIVYRTVLIQRAGLHHQGVLDDLGQGSFDMVTFSSPSAFQALRAMLGHQEFCLETVRLACIGSTTAAAVRDHGLRPTVVAADHSAQGLASAVIDFFKGEKRDDER